MSSSKQRYGVPDEENPEWTAADFRRAKSFAEMFPGRSPAVERRGQQKATLAQHAPRRRAPRVTTTKAVTKRTSSAMKKARRTPRVIETAGSVFFDLFDPAEAQRLAIQSGLALALEQEIAARKWTQAEAARRIGITQPRISNLRRRRLDKFSIDALIVYLARIGVPVRIDTSTPKRRGRAT